jgi:hypothetical protein
MGCEHFVATGFSKGFQTGMSQMELETPPAVKPGLSVGGRDDLVSLHQSRITESQNGRKNCVKVAGCVTVCER